MAKKKVKLEPVDTTRCQAEHQGGSFMTLGPRPMLRCEKVPAFVATEKNPGEDGQRGKMSLCLDCLRVMQRRPGMKNSVTLVIIPRAEKGHKDAGKKKNRQVVHRKKSVVGNRQDVG